MNQEKLRYKCLQLAQLISNEFYSVKELINAAKELEYYVYTGSVYSYNTPSGDTAYPKPECIKEETPSLKSDKPDEESAKKICIVSNELSRGDLDALLPLIDLVIQHNKRLDPSNKMVLNKKMLDGIPHDSKEYSVLSKKFDEINKFAYRSPSYSRMIDNEEKQRKQNEYDEIFLTTQAKLFVESAIDEDEKMDPVLHAENLAAKANLKTNEEILRSYNRNTELPAEKIEELADVPSAPLIDDYVDVLSKKVPQPTSPTHEVNNVFGYDEEQLSIRGDIINNADIKNTTPVPDLYLETLKKIGGFTHTDAVPEEKPVTIELMNQHNDRIKKIGEIFDRLRNINSLLKNSNDLNDENLNNLLSGLSNMIK